MKIFKKQDIFAFCVNLFCYPLHKLDSRVLMLKVFRKTHWILSMTFTLIWTSCHTRINVFPSNVLSVDTLEQCECFPKSSEFPKQKRGSLHHILVFCLHSCWFLIHFGLPISSYLHSGWGSSLSNDALTFLSPATSSCSSGGIPRYSQKSWEM